MDYNTWVSMTVEQRFAHFCKDLFVGLAIPCDVTTADGGTMRSEKVLKFNKKALHNITKEKEKPAYSDHKEYHIPRIVEHYNNPDNIEQEVSYFG